VRRKSYPEDHPYSCTSTRAYQRIKMNATLGHLPLPCPWPGTISILLLTALVVFISNLLWRHSFPDKAPKVWSGDDWPILGSIRFYCSRRDMLWTAQKTTKTGNVSFYLGKKQIISVSGSTEARKTFFETKDLHLQIG
jgi:sterol 14-demethylase